MRNIFIGLLFVFLDFNLTFGASQIGLIPDFVGYILMIQGLAELQNLSPRFIKARPFALGMAVYTGILYMMDAFGIGIGSILSFTLGLISTLISLYISYNIVMGVKDIEAMDGRDLNAQGLYSVWTVLAILSLIIYVLLIVPILNFLCMIAGLIAGIVFLVSFNRTKNLYYGMI
jgi:hypothetical protein